MGKDLKGSGRGLFRGRFTAEDNNVTSGSRDKFRTDVSNLRVYNIVTPTLTDQLLRLKAVAQIMNCGIL